MLTSLFGELNTSKDLGDSAAEQKPERSFGAKAIAESVDTELNSRGLIVDRRLRDLVVTGSPALAIREHFAASRSDMEAASQQITLYDPASAWAGAVVKALSDAGGGPIDRLHLREETTLRSLATIERTVLVRRNEDTLKIYNVDVRAPGPENAEIPITLMEGSHLAVIIVGPMEPHAIDALLTSLFTATGYSTWRCPNLLFILPPSALWIANKIGAAAWPSTLSVQVINDSLSSASAVWNALLRVWNGIKERSVGETTDTGRIVDPTSPPVVTTVTPHVESGQAPLPRIQGPSPVQQRAAQALVKISGVPGLLGCAVVESSSGMLLASQVRDSQVIDLALASAASTQVLRSHRLASHNMGLTDPVREVITSTGSCCHIIRTVSKHPEFFLFALLDEQNTDLSLARDTLILAERSLV